MDKILILIVGLSILFLFFILYTRKQITNMQEDMTLMVDSFRNLCNRMQDCEDKSPCTFCDNYKDPYE